MNRPDSSQPSSYFEYPSSRENQGQPTNVPDFLGEILPPHRNDFSPHANTPAAAAPIIDLNENDQQVVHSAPLESPTTNVKDYAAPQPNPFFLAPEHKPARTNPPLPEVSNPSPPTNPIAAKTASPAAQKTPANSLFSSGTGSRRRPSWGNLIFKITIAGILALVGWISYAHFILSTDNSIARSNAGQNASAFPLDEFRGLLPKQTTSSPEEATKAQSDETDTQEFALTKVDPNLELNWADEPTPETSVPMAETNKFALNPKPRFRRDQPVVFEEDTMPSGSQITPAVEIVEETEVQPDSKKQNSEEAKAEPTPAGEIVVIESNESSSATVPAESESIVVPSPEQAASPKAKVLPPSEESLVNLRKAERMIRKRLETEPKNLNLILILSENLESQGNFWDAWIALARSGVSTDKRFANRLIHLALPADRAEETLILLGLGTPLEASWENDERVAIAELYEASGDINNAISILRSTRGSEAKKFRLEAIQAHKRGFFSKAREYQKKFVEISKSPTQSDWRFLADLNRLTGHNEEARDAYKKAGDNEEL